jgi:hypothetical protein
MLYCKQTSDLFEASSENMLDLAIQHLLIINDVEIHQKDALPVAA